MIQIQSLQKCITAFYKKHFVHLPLISIHSYRGKLEQKKKTTIEITLKLELMSKDKEADVFSPICAPNNKKKTVRQKCSEVQASLAASMFHQQDITVLPLWKTDVFPYLAICSFPFPNGLFPCLNFIHICLHILCFLLQTNGLSSTTIDATLLHMYFWNVSNVHFKAQDVICKCMDKVKKNTIIIHSGVWTF